MGSSDLRPFDLDSLRPDLGSVLAADFFLTTLVGRYVDRSTSTPSTSIRPALGSAATWYVARAG